MDIMGTSAGGCCAWAAPVSAANDSAMATRVAGLVCVAGTAAAALP